MNFFEQLIADIINAAIDRKFKAGREVRVLALQDLKIEQHSFLLSFGWVEVEPDAWQSPFGYDRTPKLRTFGHAVNSQLWVCHNTKGWCA